MLHRKQRRRLSSSTEALSDDDESYRPRSRTPLSKSYSYREEHHHKQRSKSRPTKAWGITLWARLCAKSRSLRLLGGLIEQTFLDNSYSPCLPYIMVEQTRWNMSTILTKEWLYIWGIRPCYTGYSHLVWGQSWWSGLTVWGKGQSTPFKSLLGPLGLDLSLVVGFLTLWTLYCLWLWEKVKL